MPSAPAISSPIIVLKALASGERFARVSVLTPEHGVLHLLARRRSKPPFLLVDLYDSGDALFELKLDGQNGFLKDFELRQRRSGIGRDYSTLETAARLSAFLLANPIHPEDEASIYELATKALNALDQGQPPEAALLKTLFTYCRDEGYPVVERWAKQLDPNIREAAIQILNTPLNELTIDRSIQRIALDTLAVFIERETHIRLS